MTNNSRSVWTLIQLAAAATVCGVALTGLSATVADDLSTDMTTQHVTHDTHGMHPGGVRQATPVTTVRVDVSSDLGVASRRLLGVNHHYNRNAYGLWDEGENSPVPTVVAKSIRTGVQAMRYPGGTIANLFDWTRAVGDAGVCQVDGRSTDSGAFPAVRTGLAFGPDEYMRFLGMIDADPLIMVPSVTETPAGAANWVEYMNSPSTAPGNPNGGRDWADVRAANGHPAPYGVQRWEIGNEQHHDASRYWMSNNTSTALRQYAFGDSVDITGEALGKNCAHPRGGIASDGSPNQVFEVLYPPFTVSNLQLRVGNTVWNRVEDVSAAPSTAHVYEAAPLKGEITFGDGEHGAIPATGAHVRATYRSVHAGYFEFARAMHSVDPGIKVCSSWGTPSFPAVAGARDYDCLSAHAITSFEASGTDDWSNPLEGHDRLMLASEKRRQSIQGLLDAVPNDTPLWLTEFTAINGDTTDFPFWPTSASHAVYMATLWRHWLTLNIPYATGGDFLWGFDRAVLGPAPDYTYTAQAVTREAISPMFTASGKVLRTSIEGNPVRDPGLGNGAYPGLITTATRGPGGDLFLLVINRLPTKDITTKVSLAGFTSNKSATVRTVASNNFQDFNKSDQPPEVALVTTTREIGAARFTHTFPSTSTTVFRISPTS